MSGCNVCNSQHQCLNPRRKPRWNKRALQKRRDEEKKKKRERERERERPLLFFQSGGIVLLTGWFILFFSPSCPTFSPPHPRFFFHSLFLSVFLQWAANRSALEHQRVQAGAVVRVPHLHGCVTSQFYSRGGDMKHLFAPKAASAPSQRLTSAESGPARNHPP